MDQSSPKSPQDLLRTNAPHRAKFDRGQTMYEKCINFLHPSVFWLSRAILPDQSSSNSSGNKCPLARPLGSLSNFVAVNFVLFVCTARNVTSPCSCRLPVYGHLTDPAFNSVYTNLLGVGLRIPSAKLALGDLTTSSPGTCFDVDAYQATIGRARAAPASRRNHPCQ